jgi:hypothetical protein
MNLASYTWDQATICRLATARGFKAFGIAPSTVRTWAKQGLITPAGKAPGGAHLYPIADVAAAAERPRRKPGRPRARACIADRNSQHLETSG